MRIASGLDLYSPAFENMEKKAMAIVDNYIDANRDKLKLAVMSVTGKGIGSDEEVEFVADDLLYFIFANIEFDEGYVDRFVKQNVTPNALEDLSKRFTGNHTENHKLETSEHDLNTPAFEELENKTFVIIDSFVDQKLGVNDPKSDEMSHFLFENLSFDPESVNRFLAFHLNERYLSDVVSDYLDYLEGKKFAVASKPSQIVEKIRLIASAIENSKNPSRSLVAADLQKVLSLLK